MKQFPFQIHFPIWHRHSFVWGWCFHPSSPTTFFHPLLQSLAWDDAAGKATGICLSLRAHRSQARNDVQFQRLGPDDWSLTLTSGSKFVVQVISQVSEIDVNCIGKSPPLQIDLIITTLFITSKWLNDPVSNHLRLRKLIDHPCTKIASLSHSLHRGQQPTFFGAEHQCCQCMLTLEYILYFLDEPTHSTLFFSTFEIWRQLPGYISLFHKVLDV